MRKALNMLVLLAALSVSAVAASQASADSCCVNGKCNTCCTSSCTHCDENCSNKTCCKKK
jgi:hypothetical protein